MTTVNTTEAARHIGPPGATSGPWQMGKGPGNVKRIFNADGMWYVATVAEGGEIDADWPANQRLITAAPELYAALKTLLAETEGATCDTPTCPACQAEASARAALAKAEL